MKKKICRIKRILNINNKGVCGLKANNTRMKPSDERTRCLPSQKAFLSHNQSLASLRMIEAQRWNTNGSGLVASPEQRPPASRREAASAEVPSTS